jgi:hypothetical protein
MFVTETATVKRQISRRDSRHSHEEQLALINNSVKAGQFTVDRVDRKNSILLKKWWPKHYKNPVLPTSCYDKEVPKHQNLPFRSVLQWIQI